MRHYTEETYGYQTLNYILEVRRQTGGVAYAANVGNWTNATATSLQPGTFYEVYLKAMTTSGPG